MKYIVPFIFPVFFFGCHDKDFTRSAIGGWEADESTFVASDGPNFGFFPDPFSYDGENISIKVRGPDPIKGDSDGRSKFKTRWVGRDLYWDWGGKWKKFGTFSENKFVFERDGRKIKFRKVENSIFFFKRGL